MLLPASCFKTLSTRLSRKSQLVCLVLRHQRHGPAFPDLAEEWRWWKRGGVCRARCLCPAFLQQWGFATASSTVCWGYFSLCVSNLLTALWDISCTGDGLVGKQWSCRTLFADGHVLLQWSESIQTQNREHRGKSWAFWLGWCVLWPYTSLCDAVVMWSGELKHSRCWSSTYKASLSVNMTFSRGHKNSCTSFKNHNSPRKCWEGTESRTEDAG